MPNGISLLCHCRCHEGAGTKVRCALLAPLWSKYGDCFFLHKSEGVCNEGSVYPGPLLVPTTVPNNAKQSELLLTQPCVLASPLFDCGPTC